MTDTAYSVALPGSSPTRDGSGTRTTGVALQAKTLFKPLAGGLDGAMAWCAIRKPMRAVSTVRQYPGQPFLQGRPFRVTHQQRLAALEGDRARSPHLGPGFGNRLAQRTWLIAEPFGQHQGRPFGSVTRLAPGRAQIDATYGNRFGRGTGEHWFSVGLRLLSPRFPP